MKRVNRINFFFHFLPKSLNLFFLKINTFSKNLNPSPPVTKLHVTLVCPAIQLGVFRQFGAACDQTYQFFEAGPVHIQFFCHQLDIERITQIINSFCPGSISWISMIVNSLDPHLLLDEQKNKHISKTLQSTGLHLITFYIC